LNPWWAKRRWYAGKARRARIERKPLDFGDGDSASAGLLPLSDTALTLNP
jgi:hypothetical protein